MSLLYAVAGFFGAVLLLVFVVTIILLIADVCAPHPDHRTR